MWFKTAILSAVSFATLGLTAHAQPTFEGKPITLIIGASPGGGYDAYARTLSRHLSRHLPGEPEILVRNQPGAGSGAAAGALQNTAPKDGTTIGAIFPGIVMHPILDPASPLQFDPKEFNFLGSADNSTRVCAIWHESPTKTFADAQKRETVLGASAAGGSSRDYAHMLNNIAGTKFDVVSGYKGSAAILLAMERREIDGMCGFDWASLRAQRPDWIKDGKVNVIVETALEPTEDLQKRGVPIFWQYVKDETDRKAAELIVSQQVFGRPYVAPPGVPEDVVATLRQGVLKTLQDPAYVADAEKSRLNVQPVPGEKVQKLVGDIYNAPAEVADRARQIIKGSPNS